MPDESSDTGQPVGDAVASPVNVARAIAFHAPSLLIGGCVLMPVIYSIIAESRILLDDETSRAITQLYNQEPARLVLFGLFSLGTVNYAYGARLKFSVSRYLTATLILLFMTMLALSSAARSGGASPIFFAPLGGGLIAILVTTVLGFAGTRIYDLIYRGSNQGVEGSKASWKQKVASGAAVAALFLAVVGYFAMTAPQNEYLGLKLGMVRAQVIAAMGQPLTVGDPIVATLPDGAVALLPSYHPGSKADFVEQARALAPKARARHWPLLPAPTMISDVTTPTDTTLAYGPLERENVWFYEGRSGRSLIRLQFDVTNRLWGIWCLASDPAECPALLKAKIGMSEQQIWDVAGHPTTGLLDPNYFTSFSEMSYERDNVNLWLHGKTITTSKAYLLGVRGPYRN